jgi:macrodomain Ter protein organizer (MatP/YcbG family)
MESDIDKSAVLEICFVVYAKLQNLQHQSKQECKMKQSIGEHRTVQHHFSSEKIPSSKPSLGLGINSYLRLAKNAPDRRKLIS